MHEHTQRDFLAAVRGETSQVALGASLIPPDVTWQIYRRNYLDAHVGALEDTYSTVRSLVGEAFFRVLARQFVGESHSVSGELNDYGNDFAHFLAGSRIIETLPYLEDVARLDWAWLDMLRCPHQGGHWLAQLLALSPDAWPQATARAAGTIITSAYPLYSIYMLATEGGETVDLSQGAQAILISMSGQVQVTLLTNAQAACVARWFSGSTLEAALEAGLAIDEQLDISALLCQLAAVGAVHSIESI